MIETLLDKIQSIIDELNVYDKEYRKLDEDAWEISDLEEAKRVRDETLIVIRKIKQFKSTLQILSEDISNSGISLKATNLSSASLENTITSDDIIDSNKITTILQPLTEQNLPKDLGNPLIKEDYKNEVGYLEDTSQFDDIEHIESQTSYAIKKDNDVALLNDTDISNSKIKLVLFVSVNSSTPTKQPNLMVSFF